MPSLTRAQPRPPVPLGFLPADTPLAPAAPTRARGPNQPFGLAFMGAAWTEFALLSYAYAYEQATQTRLRVRAFSEAVPRTQLADVVRARGGGGREGGAGTGTGGGVNVQLRA